MNMMHKKISELSKSYVQMFEQIRRDVHREKELDIVNFYDLDFFEILGLLCYKIFFKKKSTKGKDIG